MVRVRLLPWEARISFVTTEVSVEGMPPTVEKLVLSDAAGLPHVFEEALLHLPVAAADWTNGAVKKAVNAYLSEHLPEFRADFDIKAQEKTQVKLVLYPRLPVVRTTDLSMRSDTVPNFTLLARRDQLQHEIDTLVGVPVAFVARHRAAFEEMFAKSMDASKGFRTFDMHTEVTMDPAERMHVMSRSDSARWRLRLTGWLDIGRKAGARHKREEDLLFRGHIGYMARPRDEVFFRAYVYPQTPDWWTEAGVSHRLGSRTHAELRYDFHDKRMIFGADYSFAPKWLFRYEYRAASRSGEAALRYAVHDFLSLEYAADSEGGWLRLLGNF